MAQVAVIGETTEALGDLKWTLSATGEELQRLRATFLFTAFGMMAMAQTIRVVAEKFTAMKESMVDAWSAIEFQAAAVSTILVGTADDLDVVVEKMLQLGRDTEWTAVQVGEGMEVLARAGLDTTEVLGAIEPVLKMATANNMQVADAARFAAGSYRGWSLEGETLTDVLQNVEMVTTMVTHAARSSRQEVHELADAFKYVTAAAMTVGWEMEEVLAGLMVAADNMISAGMAGRSFRRVMTRIGTIAGDVSLGIEDARRMVRGYGIELQDQEGNLVGFIDLVRQLEEVTADLNTTQKVLLYQQLAGMRGMNALAAAVDEGAESLEKKAYMLKLSAVTQAIFTEHGIDSRKQLLKWREELEKAWADGKEYNTILDEMNEHVGLSAEVMYRLNDVLMDTTISIDEFKEALKEATIVCEMTQARLETLHGTQILLASSMEALWAELARGQFAELMAKWNLFMRDVTDWMAKLPEPFKVTISILILAISIIGQFASSLLMFGAMIMIQRAAIASLNLEMYMMAKNKILNMELTASETSAIVNQIVARNGITKATEIQNLTQSFSNIKTGEAITLAKTKYKVDITNLFNTKLQTEATRSQAEMQMLLNTQMVHYKKIVGLNLSAIKGLTAGMWKYTIATTAATFGIGLLIMGFMQGNDAAKIFGTVLVSLAVVMWILKRVNFSLTLSFKALSVSILGCLSVFLILYYLYPRMTKTVRVLTGAVLVLVGAMIALYIVKKKLVVLSGGLIWAIGVIIAGIVLLIDYFIDITGRTQAWEEELVGNTLLDALIIIANAIVRVGNAIKWVIGLFEKIFDTINKVKEGFIDLAKLSDKLMGNSVIPENFERGAGRIQNVMDELNEDMVLNVGDGEGRISGKAKSTASGIVVNFNISGLILTDGEIMTVDRFKSHLERWSETWFSKIMRQATRRG